MSSPSQPPALLGYASMVRCRWRLIVTIVLVMTIPAVVVSLLETPVYRASGKLLLLRERLDENFNSTPGVLTDTQVGNEVALLTGMDVVDRANKLGATSVVLAVGSAGSNVVALSADDPDPRKAAATVDAFMKAYSEYRVSVSRQTLDVTAAQLQSSVTDLDNQIEDLGDRESDQVARERANLEQRRSSAEAKLGQVQVQQGLVSPGVTVVARPEVPTSAIRPTPLRNGLLAVVLGLLLGVSLAVLLESLRRGRAEGEAAEPDVSMNTMPLATTAAGGRSRGRSRRKAPAMVGTYTPDDSAQSPSNGHRDPND